MLSFPVQFRDPILVIEVDKKKPSPKERLIRVLKKSGLEPEIISEDPSTICFRIPKESLATDSYTGRQKVIGYGVLVLNLDMMTKCNEIEKYYACI